MTVVSSMNTAAAIGELANTFQVASAPKTTGVTKQNVRNPRRNRSQIMNVVAVYAQLSD